MTHMLLCGWFFLLGTAMGSFFNVLADRLPEGRDCIFTRSACSACGTHLKWYDLIPVISFLLIGGKCRYCGAKLSAWYPVSELAVGGLYVAACARFIATGSFVRLAGDLLLWSLLFIVAAMDGKYGIIMDLFSILIAAGGILLGLLSHRGIVEILLGGITGAACFGILYLVSKWILKREGLGLGDVFLLGSAGFWLPWTQVIITAFLTAYVALIFILIKAVREKKIGLKTELPLGPSICMAIWIMSIAGDAITGLIVGIILP